MKSFKYISGAIAALVLMAFASCTNEEPDNNGTEGQDDEYWAALAAVSSSDAAFTSTSEGGRIRFAAEGGMVTVSVDCGTDWMVENHASDLFSTTADVNAGTLTVTAVQNTEETEFSGTVTLLTLSRRVTFATLTITQSAYGAPEIEAETREWRAPAAGELSTDIAVDATADWYVESADEWITAEKAGDSVRITAAENGETAERSGEVVLACSDGIRVTNEYIEVIQDAKAYVSFSRENVSFAVAAETSTVSVESNYSWDYSYDTANGWFTVERDGSALDVTVSTNGGEKRSGTVTVSAGDGAENVVEGQFTVTQYGSDALVLTYTITSAGTKVTLPLGGTVNCTVDWGDGSIETVKSEKPSHTYSVAETYNVCVDGAVTALNSSDIASSDSPNTTLKSVRQWGTTGLTSLSSAFYCCEGLKSVPADDGKAFSDVTTLRNIFYGCSSLEEIPKGIFDRCSKVTTLYAAFYNCSSITSVPDGLFDACTETANCEYVFYGCSGITEIPSDLFASCKKSTSFYATFYKAGLTAVPDGFFKDFDKVTSFAYTFAHCASLTTVGSKVFSGCSAVTSFAYLFYGCNLTSIPYGLFDDCTEVTSFKYVFNGNKGIASIPEGLFDNCTKVTTFESTFEGCGITSIPGGLFDNCSLCTSFMWTFYGCTSLEEIPKGLFDNCPEVMDFSDVFRGAVIKEIPEGLFDKNTKVTNFGGAFYSCKKLKAIPAGLFDNCPAVTNFSFVFYTCTKLTEIPDGLFDNCPNVTTFGSAFYECENLLEIPDGLFDNCPNVTNFSFVFSDCYELKAIPSGLFDKCPNVTSLSAAFQVNYSLAEIPAGLFDNCPEVTDISNVFFECYFKTVPEDLLSNCLKITNFQAAFSKMTEWEGESPYSVLADGTKVHVYERGAYASELGCAVPTSYSLCFTNDKGLTDYSQIPSAWGGGATTSSVSSVAQKMVPVLDDMHEAEPVALPSEI